MDDLVGMMPVCQLSGCGFSSQFLSCELTLWIIAMTVPCLMGLLNVTRYHRNEIVVIV